MIKKLIFVLLVFFIQIHEAIAADFQFTSDECSGFIKFTGTIKKGDAQTFENKINYYKKRWNEGVCGIKTSLPKDFKFFLTIYLDSNGGDVDEAMKIGYIIRENGFYAYVVNKSECLSSCVFILASGVRRGVSNSNVGIHRPYFSDINDRLSVSDIKKLREDNIKKMKAYFNFMDISETVVDAMLSVEPNKIKILTESELENFRLSIPDANYEEKTIAEEARRYNLTSSEYRRKEVIVNSKCGTTSSNMSNLQALFKCQSMIYLDISGQEYERRRTKAFQNCGDIKNAEEKRNECFYKINVLNQ